MLGSYINDRNDRIQNDRASETMLKFSIDKLEALKKVYDPDTMEALVSNVYAAYALTPDIERKGALYTLWNALIFDGESIAGREDELIKVLRGADPDVIEKMAYSIRGIGEVSGGNDCTAAETVVK